jgi:hypothetical protein
MKSFNNETLKDVLLKILGGTFTNSHTAVISQFLYDQETPPEGSALSEFLKSHPSSDGRVIDGDGDSDGDQVDSPSDPPEGPGGL